MRNLIVCGVTLFLLSLGSSARADVSIAGSALIGTGFDNGAPHNPYAFQVGGTVELIIYGFVLGARATRAITSGDVDRELDLRAFGGDLGWEWELLSILHIGPRVGMGQARQIDGEWKSLYVEPGIVAEVELSIFVLGADARYRFVTEDMDLSGFLIYAKLGLRF